MYIAILKKKYSCSFVITFSQLLIYCLSAPKSIFPKAVVHIYVGLYIASFLPVSWKCTWTTIFPLQLAPCQALPVEGAGEISQEGRVLFLGSVVFTVWASARVLPLQGQAPAVSAQQHQVVRSCPQHSLRHLPSCVPPVRHFPWTARLARYRMGWILVKLHHHCTTATFSVTQWAEASCTLSSEVYISTSGVGNGSGAFSQHSCDSCSLHLLFL